MDPGPGPVRHILTEPVLVVRVTWPTPGTAEYHVFDEEGSQLATARYLPKDEVAFLLGTYGLRPWTAAVLRIDDLQGQTLFTVAFPGMRARAVMFIRNADGEHLGEAVKTKGGTKVRYEIRHREQALGAIQVLDWRQREVRVEDTEGAEIASIRTIDEGVLGADRAVAGRAAA